MVFSKIENALNVCKSHLDSLDRNDPKIIEIENYLVAGLVILIVSEYETLIEDLFSTRADMCGDSHVASYTKSMIAQTFRSPDLTKITSTLNRFGRDYKHKFSNKILNTPQHAAWDNIMKARHAIVHKKSNLNLTFRELQSSYQETKTVIAEICNTLGVSSPV